MTAHDVVTCFRYGAAAHTESLHAYMNVVIAGTDDEGHATPADLGVRALDAYTVRFTLKSSFAAFADTLGTPFARLGLAGGRAAAHGAASL